MVDGGRVAQGDVLLFDDTQTNSPSAFTAHKGDVDAAFRDAPYARASTSTCSAHTAMPMETRGLLAEWDAASRRLDRARARPSCRSSIAAPWRG